MGGLSYHCFVQNFEIYTFPLFLADIKILKFSHKNIIGFSTFFSKNDQITISAPKRGLTDCGKVLLKMRQAEGVPIKQLSRDFNVSRRIIKKYQNEKKSSGEYTLSPVTIYYK